MSTFVLELMINKNYRKGINRFICSNEDYGKLIKEGKINVKGQMIENPNITISCSKDIAVGNIKPEYVTLN